MAGNRPVVKSDTKVSIVLEQFIRLLHYCGLPKEDLDFINCDGPVMEKILVEGKPRQTLFTGSSRIAERLCNVLNGRICIEDAGFDWKILGPDVKDFEYVCWQSD
jgi:1-pyrroline-5-carboxylate dehydrogenase